MPFDAMPVVDTSTSQLLERALERIADPENWGRFRFARHTLFTRTPRYCMLGALTIEARGMDVRPAMDALAMVINPCTNYSPGVAIMYYNDSSLWQMLWGKQTRHCDIVAAMQRAISHAKAMEASRTWYANRARSYALSN